MGLLGIFLLATLCIGLPLALVMGGIGSYLESRNEKTCVECAETILKDARKCKHCGAMQPESVKAVAVPAETALPAIANRQLSDKAGRLKDSPGMADLQTRLRDELARGQRKRFWWAVGVTTFLMVSAASRGARFDMVIAQGVMAGAGAMLVYLLLGALHRRKLNAAYRAGVEGMDEPAPMAGQEAAQ
ncbi:hypothetical protein [Mesorhizobium australicum]|uniref:Zinc ribbon domain-containing protein n=1 Tax=Mesorhizobium australicum TaxID=536018 RepID=A0A1X7N0A9_9HYPH|nr:hypothetical protein [Mesorhizobium australicum]SMH30150.1 hypothetical protein SAMN02982922_1003 [Mesorhizobium australicum]